MNDLIDDLGLTPADLRDDDADDGYDLDADDLLGDRLRRDLIADAGWG